MQDSFLKTIKPVTSSQRFLKTFKYPYLWTKKKIKTKSFGLVNKAGRNNSGKITFYQKGGGHKKLYRVIDFARENPYGIVQGVEYDPYRNTFLARVCNNITKHFYYILAAKNLFAGSVVRSGENAQIKLGHALPFSKIPVGMLIHNISCYSKVQGQYARAAGAFAQLIQKTNNFARIRLISGEQRLVSIKAKATLGVVSNENFNLTTRGKAGRSRWLNCRPNVRGVAMNPVDHPHGGGEGKTSGGRPSVTAWGKPTRGVKTTRSRNKMVVVKRTKNKI